MAVDVHSGRNSIGSAKDHHVSVPAHVPNGMDIAVTPSANSLEKFWVANIVSVKTEQPLVYNIRYYNYSKSKKGWVLMKGEEAYGWVPHSAILAAGIEFNANKSMKAASVQHITIALQQQKT